MCLSHQQGAQVYYSVAKIMVFYVILAVGITDGFSCGQQTLSIQQDGQQTFIDTITY